MTRGRLRAASSFLATEMGPFLLENEMFGNLIDSDIPAIPKAPPAPMEFPASFRASDDFRLCDAIRNTVDAAQDAQGMTLRILQRHLLRLCNLQVEQLEGCGDDHS